MTNNIRFICCICHKPIKVMNGWVYGNNAEPVKSGQCCDYCNDNVVLPERIRRIQKYGHRGKPRT
jgi:hypothetical protein